MKNKFTFFVKTTKFLLFNSVIPAKAGIQALKLFLRRRFVTWTPAFGVTMLPNLNLLRLLILMVALVAVGGCKKKDRLAANSFLFGISPPNSQVVVGGTQVLTIQSNVFTNPSWTVDSSTLATLNTSIGNQVTLTTLALGDVIVSATFDGAVATARVAVVTTYMPGVSGVFDVYSDNGLPTGTGILSDIQIDNIAKVSVSEQNGTEYTPEGNKFLRSTWLANFPTWRVTLDKNAQGFSKDLSAFSATSLKFFLKLNRTLLAGENVRLRIQGGGITGLFTLVDGMNGFSKGSIVWQQISVPISSFAPAPNLALVKAPFEIEIDNFSGGSLIFDVDAIRWE